MSTLMSDEALRKLLIAFDNRGELSDEEHLAWFHKVEEAIKQQQQAYADKLIDSIEVRTDDSKWKDLSKYKQRKILDRYNLVVELRTRNENGGKV